MLLQYWVTFTYFAYICSSRGKLWTFLSSLAWKVPNLIHLFVGYLERKQWSQVMKCRNFLLTGIYTSFSQCLSRAETHFVLSSCKAAAKFPTQHLSRSLTQWQQCASPWNTKSQIYPTTEIQPVWSEAPQMNITPGRLHCCEQAAENWAEQRSNAHQNKCSKPNPTCFGHPRNKGVFLMPLNACSLQKALGAQPCLNHPKATLKAATWPTCSTLTPSHFSMVNYSSFLSESSVGFWTWLSTEDSSNHVKMVWVAHKLSGILLRNFIICHPLPSYCINSAPQQIFPFHF